MYVVACPQIKTLKQKQRSQPKKAAIIQVGALKEKTLQETLPLPTSLQEPQACTNASAHPQRKWINQISKHYVSKAFKETWVSLVGKSQHVRLTSQFVVLWLPKYPWWVK